MIKLFKNSKKLFMFNLIIILSLMFSFIGYSIYADQNEHLVVEAAKSKEAEEKTVFEFKSDYLEEKKEFKDKTPLYQNDLRTYKAFLTLENGAIMLKENDMGGLYYDGQNKTLNKGTLTFIRLAGDDGIDKKIWSTYGTKFEDHAINREKPSLTSYKSAYNITDRSSSETDFIAYVPNGEIDEYSEFEDKKVLQEIYSEYRIKQKDTNMDDGEKYILSNLGSSDVSPNNYPNYIQKALWKYRYRNGLSVGEVSDDDDAKIDEILVNKAEEYKNSSKDITDSQLSNVKWKSGTEKGINYDNVKVNYDSTINSYIVGPFAIEYDSSIASFKDMATFELYTNTDVEGVDLHGTQTRFSIIHCDKNNGKIISGYEELDKNFPESGEPFYVRYQFNYEDINDITDEEFLTLPRIITNIKVKLRVEKPEVKADLLNGKGYYQEFVVRAKEKKQGGAVVGKYYYLEPKGIVSRNWAELYHVKESKLSYEVKEVNKYLDIKIGKIIINSELLDADEFDESMHLSSSEELKYKIEVTGNIFEYDGKAEDYALEEIKVPLSGQVISRDYAWVGNKKPKYKVTVEGYNSKYYELMYNMVSVEKTVVGNAENDTVFEKEEIDVKEDKKLGINGDLESGITTLRYKYIAKFDNETVEDDNSLFSYGKIAVDNIVHHDASLRDDNFSLESATQAYLLTIIPGDNSSFVYSDPNSGIDQIYSMDNVYKKLIILNGRNEEDEIILQKVENNILNVGNRFETGKIKWPKDSNAPQYTIERLDDIEGSDEEIYNNAFIEKYIRSTNEEGDASNRYAYFTDGIEMLNSPEYRKESEYGSISNDRWASEIGDLGIHTFRAILNEEETMNTSGEVACIDKIDNEEYGKTIVKFVTDHRKETGEISFEKRIDLENDVYFKGLDSETITEIFESLKDDVTFEFEVGIGTDVQTITLDKNYREPNYDKDGNVCGYKWVWKSGERQWLTGNELYYTIKENLNCESVLFSRIADPEIGVSGKRAYDIHGNIATGSFINFKMIQSKANDPDMQRIVFFGTFVYEECGIKIVENLRDAVYKENGASPIKHYESNDKNNIRNLLKDSTLYFNIEVNGLFAYDGLKIGEHNYRITNDKPIDLNSKELSSFDDNEYSINLENNDLEKAIVNNIENNNPDKRKFTWIKGIPPKYKIEQDTERIIANEIQNNTDENGESTGKDLDALRDIVSWQTRGVKEGELQTDINYNKNDKTKENEGNYVTFEFTNDVPTIDRNLKTGKIFIKQYVYGADDYLKETQKGFEFTYDVEVTARRKNTPEEDPNNKKNSLTLLNIDNLVIKPEVADDGNYVWEWTSPEITWDADYLDTPDYMVKIEKSKLPAGMKLDQIEKACSDVNAPKDRNCRIKNNKSIDTITDKLTEMGVNENKEQHAVAIEEQELKIKDIDERLETTDVYFYASYGAAKKSKIKLVQSLDSDTLLRKDNEPSTDYVRIAVTGNFIYNNEEYNNGIWYLTQNKSLTQDKKEAEICLDVGDDLVESYISNYFSWNGDSPKFWIETEKNNNEFRTTYPYPEKSNPMSIDSPIGVMTIVDSYYKEKQSSKVPLSIRITKDEDAYNFDLTLPKEYEKSMELYFKIHIDNRMDTYVKATRTGDGVWSYSGQDIKYNPNDNVNYVISTVNCNPYLDIFWNQSDKMTTGPIDNLKNNWKYKVHDKTIEAKGRYHIVALRNNNQGETSKEFKINMEGINNLGDTGVSKNMTDILTFSDGAYSTEYYSNYFYTENKMVPYYVSAEGKPYYWKTNSGQLIEADNRGTINIVIDYRYDSEEKGSSKEDEISIQKKFDTDNERLPDGYEEKGLRNITGTMNILLRPAFLTDVYVQGYGTKKMLLYSEGISNPKATGREYVTADLNQLVTWTTKTVYYEGSKWKFAENLINNNSSNYGDYAEDPSKYIFDSAEFLNYKITDYELPIGYEYKKQEDYRASQSEGVLTGSGNKANDESIWLRYNTEKFPASKTLTIDNKYVDGKIKNAKVEYEAEVSGTYQYIVNNKVKNVVNGSKTFRANATGNGIFAFEEEGTPIRFMWEEDNKAPRYSIRLASDKNASNIQMVNAAGYMKNTAVTSATARNQYNNVGGYIYVSHMFKDENGENIGIKPSRKFEFIATTYKKNSEGKFILMNEFVGELSSDKQEWMSPRITWCDGEKVYYKIKPINCDDYMQDIEIKAKDADVEEISEPDKYGDKYIELKPHDYESLKYSKPRVGAHAIIIYKVKLQETKISLKNARIHMQEPKDRNNLNQEFDVKVHLDGNYIDITNGIHEGKDTNTSMYATLKASSSESKANAYGDGSSAELRILHFPDEKIKISVDEEIKEGEKSDNWKNINISNTENYIVGEDEVTIYLTNQYSEFKMIDLTTKIGGKVTLSDGGVPNTSIEVYANKIDDYSTQLKSIDKFGFIRSQPTYTNTKTGKWEMSGILIPQLYTKEFQIMYRYDGQMYKAINEFDENTLDDYINNPSDRSKYKDTAKVRESAYERQKFNDKFENVSGKKNQDVNGESVASISKNDKLLDAMYSSKVRYDENGEPIGIISSLQNASSNLIKDEFAMTASTMVLRDEANEIIDDQNSEYDVDYEDEDSYEYLMKIPFDKQISNGNTDLILESPNSLDTDEESDTYGTKKKTYRSSSYLKDINLKLEKRNDVEVSMHNELLNIRNVANGVKETLYDMEDGNSDARIECGINSTDYYYRADVYRQNDNYAFLRKLYDSKGYNLEDTEMEIYLTYKYVLENNSDEYVIKVDELDNYVSNSMEIVNISEGEVAKNISYCPANEDIRSLADDNSFRIAGSSYLKELYGEDDNKHYDDFTYKVIPEYKVSNKVIANQENNNDETSFDKIVLYLQGEKGLYLVKDEPQEIYVDYRIKKKNIEGVNNTLDIGNVIKNIIEIGKYSTYESDGFSEDDKLLAGKISDNFAPNNLNIAQCYSSHTYEADTSMCNQDVVLKVDYGMVDDKSGKVYEKETDGEDSALIGGMTVQLLERMYISGVNDKPDEYRGGDFLWSTDKPLCVYGGKSFYEAQLNSAAESGMEATAEKNRFSSTVETDRRNDIGSYKFSNIPNGKFVARVLYGFDKGNLDNTIDTTGEPVALKDTGEYYSKGINGGEVLTANFNEDKTGATPAVYNGQDYKSAYTDVLEDGSVPYGDDETRRIEAMACDMTFINENTRIFAGLNDKNAVHQKVYDNYYMYLMGNKINDRNNIEEEDFALTRRPQTEIYLDQQIENIKIITNDGRVIFDAIYDISYDIEDSSDDEDDVRDSGYKIKDIKGKDKSIYANVNLNHSKSVGIDMLQELYKKEYKITNDLERYGNKDINKRNFKYINIDDVILQGTTIQINYRISAINVSELDYIGKDIESAISINNSSSVDNKDFSSYYNQSKLRSIAKEVKENTAKKLGGESENEGIESKVEFGNKLGEYFYTRRQGDNLSPVKTRVRQLLNYVDNDMVFSTDSNNTDNNYWRTSSAAELNGNGLDRNRMVEDGQIDVYKVVDKNNMAYFTNERNNIAVSVDAMSKEGVSNKGFEQLTVPYEHYSLHKDEQVGETLDYMTHMNLITTKTVSSLSQADNMSYDTLTEIVKYENTAGRRDEIMHIGNANPKDGEFETTLLERDSSSAEIVTFMPPTGLGEKNKKIIYTIISSMMSCIIIGATIVFVKKYNYAEPSIMEIVDGKIVTNKDKKAENQKNS